MTHATHRIHPNSIATFREEEPKLKGRAAAIVAYLELHGPRTDRELASEMGFGRDLNAVRPRCTELIQSGALMEVCTVRCPVTGKPVRKVDVRRARQLELAA
jgi:hypothetical protein